jgi:hypothetical protein
MAPGLHLHGLGKNQGKLANSLDCFGRFLGTHRNSLMKVVKHGRDGTARNVRASGMTVKTITLNVPWRPHRRL